VSIFGLQAVSWSQKYIHQLEKEHGLRGFSRICAHLCHQRNPRSITMPLLTDDGWRRIEFWEPAKDFHRNFIYILTGFTWRAVSSGVRLKATQKAEAPIWLHGNLWNYKEYLLPISGIYGNMQLTKIDDRGRILLPKEIREELNLKPSEEMFVMSAGKK